MEWEINRNPTCVREKIAMCSYHHVGLAHMRTGSIFFTVSSCCDSQGRVVQPGRCDSATIWYAVIQLLLWQHWEPSPPLWCTFPPFTLLPVSSFFIPTYLVPVHWIKRGCPPSFIPHPLLFQTSGRVFIGNTKALITGILRNHNAAESLLKKSAVLTSSLSFRLIRPRF